MLLLRHTQDTSLYLQWVPKSQRSNLLEEHHTCVTVAWPPVRTAVSYCTSVSRDLSWSAKKLKLCARLGYRAEPRMWEIFDVRIDRHSRSIYGR